LQTWDRWHNAHKDGPDLDVLPALTCAAGGGEPHKAAPVVAAWQLMRLAAKLLDDAEDGDADASFAETINLATSFLSAAPLMPWGLLEQGVAADTVQHLCRALYRAALCACAGQHADLTAGQPRVDDGIDPDAWLEIAQSKSGSPLGWAAWAGALVAGTDERALSGFHDYGYHLGILLQVADDFKGVWGAEGACDLAAGQFTLPVCYALYVAKGKERERLKTLLEQASLGNRAAEVQARQLLIDLGAQGYILVVAKLQHQLATTALQRAGCPPPADRPLVALLDETMPALGLAKEER
jgi:hypothetical protein